MSVRVGSPSNSETSDFLIQPLSLSPEAENPSGLFDDPSSRHAGQRRGSYNRSSVKKEAKTSGNLKNSRARSPIPQQYPLKRKQPKHEDPPIEGEKLEMEPQPSKTVKKAGEKQNSAEQKPKKLAGPVTKKKTVDNILPITSPKSPKDILDRFHPKISQMSPEPLPPVVGLHTSSHSPSPPQHPSLNQRASPTENEALSDKPQAASGKPRVQFILPEGPLPPPRKRKKKVGMHSVCHSIKSIQNQLDNFEREVLSQLIDLGDRLKVVEEKVKDK